MLLAQHLALCKHPFTGILVCCQWWRLKSEIWAQSGLGSLQMETQPTICQTNTLTDYAVTLSLCWCPPAAQTNELPLCSS